MDTLPTIIAQPSAVMPSRADNDAHLVARWIERSESPHTRRN